MTARWRSSTSGSRRRVTRSDSTGPCVCRGPVFPGRVDPPARAPRALKWSSSRSLHTFGPRSADFSAMYCLPLLYFASPLSRLPRPSANDGDFDLIVEFAISSSGRRVDVRIPEGDGEVEGGMLARPASKRPEPMTRRLEVSSDGRISRVYVDDVEQCSKLGTFTERELAQIRPPREPEPLAVRSEWRRPCKSV